MPITFPRSLKMGSLVAALAVGLSLLSFSPASAATNLGSPLADKSYGLTSYFGYRCQPTAGASTFHDAVDLGAKDGTPIYSISNGTVKQAVTTGTPYLVIDNGTIDGQKITTTYMHMWNPLKHVKVGQKVKKGQKIAEVGNAGISTGAHLHFSVTANGKKIDPLKYMKDRGVDFTKRASYVWENTTNSTCTYYATARTALKAKPENTSDNIGMVPFGDKITMKPNGIVNGFYEVTYGGKKGYVHMNRLSATKPSTRPAVSTVKSTAGVTYAPIYTRHIFDYPSTIESRRGVLDTIDTNELFTTTGKRSGNYEEIIYGGFRGWMALDGVKKVSFTNSSANGVVESVSQNANRTLTIKGYGYDRDKPLGSVKVNFFIDGKKIKWIYADLKRTDAQRKIATSVSGPNVGFNWTSPALKPGKHEVRVQVLNADGTGGNHRTIYTKTITVK